MTESHRQPVIGLTGGIGSGKSTVAQILAELGCVVTNSDAVARDVLNEPEVTRQLVEWWGEGVLGKDGSPDRSRIASIVFNDPTERRRLEELVHPRVEQWRRQAFAAAPPEAPSLVIDAPLLLEAGLDRECDAVIFVDAARDVRLARLWAERGWDEQELHRREDSQLPLDAKRNRADYVVVNNSDIERLRAEVRRILNEIVGSPEPDCGNR